MKYRLKKMLQNQWWTENIWGAGATKIERAPAEFRITPTETEPGTISVEDDGASFIALQFPVLSLPHNPFTVRKKILLNTKRDITFRLVISHHFQETQKTHRGTHTHLFLVPLEANTSQFLKFAADLRVSVFLLWGEWSKRCGSLKG